MTLDRTSPPDPPDPAAGPKRHRTRLLAVRCTPEELKAIQAKAAKAGLANGAFARAAMLDTPGPRAQRRAPADKDALLRVLGQLGRIGGNINQIARRLNLGGAPDLPEIREALGSYLDIRNEIYKALGLDPTSRKPNPPTPKSRSPHDRKRRKPRGP